MKKAVPILGLSLLLGGLSCSPVLVTQQGPVSPVGTPTGGSSASWQLLGSILFPTLVFNLSFTVANGIPYVVFDQWSTNYDVFVMAYSGGAWVTLGGVPAAVSTNPVAQTSTVIYDSNPYVAYDNGDVSVVGYNGSTWNYLGNSGLTGTNTGYLNISADNGYPYIGFEGTGLGAVVWKYSGGAWADYATNPFNSQIWGIQTVVSNGNAYMAIEDGNLKINVSEYTAGAWTTLGSPAFTSSVGAFNIYSFAVDNGTPYVAFEDTNQSDKATVMKFNGSSWVTLGSAGMTPDPVGAVSLAVYNNTPYLAYEDTSFENEGSVLAFNGSSWNFVGKAAFTPNSAGSIKLAFDNGTPYVAFLNEDGQPQAMVYQ